MAKITSFMRVTKQPKAHGKKVDAEDETGVHIPTFIYETVKYKHKHQKHEVSPELNDVILYIKQYYDVPKDFERNAKFGAYSGLTYGKRLARAYSMGQLSLKKAVKGEAAPQPICLTCATVGHTYKCCPDGF
ncbi:hypothetical protein PHYSODRAFT_523199 [Phytophthora sojae]|uniref:Uncharacterized protein n=1 Tax=Phytophthora sojae (strain P6497) TaxID=1094619 RepID=G5A4Q7_PHYSP|nr:hypothetical protein PHYSODRAFT_523199 [Phytophthora sojae]EGZ09657.1 hypothetical protein PHYSODRAFT_523199 [Phytophthora sojae]|eukprot:XP_009534518.1 hypothetical protein PHYSODRAFT_523199 [Phytophthora sojae]